MANSIQAVDEKNLNLKILSQLKYKQTLLSSVLLNSALHRHVSYCPVVQHLSRYAKPVRLR